MDAKPTKALDEAAFNLKRKRATLHVAPLTGVLAPNSVPSNTQGTPGSPWMPFTTILVAIRNMVPLDNKFQIIQHYEQFVVCKVAQINAYVLNNKGLFDPMVPQIISIFHFCPTINTFIQTNKPRKIMGKKTPEIKRSNKRKKYFTNPD